MNVPVTISFRNMPKPQYLEDLIREKSQKLEEFCDYVSSCRVSIEKVNVYQSKGRPYRIRLDITVPPGHEIVVDRDPNRGDPHISLESDIRDAFGAAYRQVKELKQKQNRHVKTHPQQQPEAIVEQVPDVDGTGTLRTLDGRAVVFHRNSVLHHELERLNRGTAVWFAEDPESELPRATTVRIIEKPGVK
ncbi:MAG: HPF/RaiA family ribosome-associated protein [Chitinivibrionales bacterium]|nr:HPF/RaiA family ribosome-associated protein [Chitinivibrionales bacterium]